MTEENYLLIVAVLGLICIGQNSPSHTILEYRGTSTGVTHIVGEIEGEIYFSQHRIYWTYL